MNTWYLFADQGGRTFMNTGVPGVSVEGISSVAGLSWPNLLSLSGFCVRACLPMLREFAFPFP